MISLNTENAVLSSPHSIWLIHDNMQLLIFCLASFYYHLFRVDVSMSKPILHRAQYRLICSDLCCLSARRGKDLFYSAIFFSCSLSAKFRGHYCLWLENKTKSLYLNLAKFTFDSHFKTRSGSNSTRVERVGLISAGLHVRYRNTLGPCCTTISDEGGSSQRLLCCLPTHSFRLHESHTCSGTLGSRHEARPAAGHGIRLSQLPPLPTGFNG